MLSFLTDDKKIIDEGMSAALVSSCGEQDKIVEAMRYSALGGKRLRGGQRARAAQRHRAGVRPRRTN